MLDGDIAELFWHFQPKWKELDLMYAWVILQKVFNNFPTTMEGVRFPLLDGDIAKMF